MEHSERSEPDEQLLWGSGRFVLEKVLGRGAMGVVYAAYDQKRRMPVALKMLHLIDPVAFYQFKNEFRSLSDIIHPNLVTLYELVSEDDRLFFTMELIHGEDLLRFVRGGRDAPSLSRTIPIDQETLPNRTGAPLVPSLAPSVINGDGEVDIGRLRIALPNIVSGVMALHAAGKLHRDIKPSNILVRPDGRAVLCDFGLVAPLARGRGLGDGIASLVGTVPYMSPEQAACEPLTEASDWYAVGATLYRALTGSPPYAGNNVEVLTRKMTEDVAPPSTLVPGIPPDLDALCVELLDREAARRPTGPQILSRLIGERTRASRPPAALSTRSLDVTFVGRAAALRALGDAFDAARGGVPVSMLVHGRSGIGKSTLVRQFIDDATRRHGAVTLMGRCYERESVPFKGFDSLVDALATHLGEDVLQHDADFEVHVARLARLFPVMHTVLDRDAPLLPPAVGQSPQESRTRAFAALKALLQGIARRAPLILTIDDLQWGDADSIALLAEILRPPHAPAMLLVASYRSEDEPTSALLHDLAGRRGRGELGDVRDISVDALSLGDARELAGELLDCSPDDPRAAQVASESGGSPFFLRELARFFRSRTAEQGDAAPVTLDAVLRGRLEELPPGALALLSAVAVAGHPIDRRIVEDATESGVADERSLALLRSEHFVRGKTVGEIEELEPYHDRIREVAVARLAPEALRGQHLRLATAIVASGHAEDDALVTHWLGAGEPNKASAAALVAGENAARGLAFDLAARLFALSLEHGSWNEADRRSLRIKLGDALANAGRVVLAAEEYQRAAVGASVEVARDLKRRAAEHLLRSAHIDEGLALMREVLSAVGMSLPSSPQSALVSLLLRRAHLRLRGLSFREKPAAAIQPEVLARIDTCWAASTGLSLVDPIRGSAFQTKHLLMSLDAGEPSRVATGLGIEAGYMASFADPWAAKREKHLLETARALSERLGHPPALGISYTTAGISAFMRGHSKLGYEMCARGEQIFRDQCTGVQWELAAAQMFGMQCLYSLGEIAELSRVVPVRLREAEERGDVYLAGSLRTWRSGVVWLAADTPVEARAQLETARRLLPHQGFYLQRYFDLDTEVSIDLYEGDAEHAYEKVRAAWGGLKKAFLLQVLNMRIETTFLRARAAIAASRVAKGKGASTLLAAAEADARRLEREGTPTSVPFAASVRASVLHARGKSDEAFAEFRRSIDAYERVSMKMHAAAARLRLGTLQGGSEGRDMAAAAAEFMRDQSIRQPERMAAMLAP